ncbi:MAG: hypothetical protein D6798_05850, partial [Deltaproteobacteria bacterium]
MRASAGPDGPQSPNSKIRPRVWLTWPPPPARVADNWARNVLDCLHDASGMGLQLQLYTSSLGAALVRTSHDLLVELQQPNTAPIEFTAPRLQPATETVAGWLATLGDRLGWPKADPGNEVVTWAWKDTVTVEAASVVRQLVTSRDPAECVHLLAENRGPAALWA